MDFDDKVAVVTGGTGGIGREVSIGIGRGGGRIVISDIDERQGEQLVGELRDEKISACFVKTDITDMPQIESLFSSAVSKYKKIDIFVHCAGIARRTPVPEITPEEWDAVLTVNLKSTFFCAQEALKYMCPQGRGAIVTISSAAAKLGGVAVGAHYSASKAGVICLTKSLALYGAPFHINVNSVCPGPTKTPMTDAWGDRVNADFAEKIPFKRYATSKEVADAICFLASEKARYITGETLDVNGGLVLD